MLEYFKKNRLVAIIQLSRQAFGRYKFWIIALTILGFLSGLLEGIGVNALIPLFSFAIGKDQGGTDFVSLQITKFFQLFNVTFSVRSLLIFIALLFVLKSILVVYLNYRKIKITTDYEEQTRQNLFNNMLSTAWPHLLKQKLGHLESILTFDVPAASSLLNQISSVLMAATELAVYAFIAINISAPITFLTLGLGIILLFLLNPLYVRLKAIAYERIQTNKKALHYISESIVGIKTLKAMLVESGVVEKGREYFRKFRDQSVRSSMLKALTSALIEPVAVIYLLFVFGFFYKTPNFNLAALMVIIYLIQKIFLYVYQVQRTLQIVYDSVPHVRSILNYEAEAKTHREISEGSAPFVFHGALVFKDVDFSYDERKKILSGINFVVRRGETVGLVGPSGVGKTTIVDLILRLFVPTHGKIFLDGKEIAEISLQEWRKHIGYVSQDIFLMNETIANNIRFYDPNITDEEIVEAAKMAHIYDFVQGSEQKFETIIGERGTFLSAGQRQRIVIARVLARKPEILILDEATSALDSESEVKIQEVINNLRGRLTILVIAHRLSTVMNADRLVALENGRIVEEGSPRQLLADKASYFSKVYNLRGS